MTDPTDDGLQEDDLVWPILTDLRNCLEQKLTEFGGPDLCEVTIIPGDQLILDFGADSDCGGMAWVRFVTAFASTQFPIPDQTPNCFTRLAAQIEVGVMRAAPSPEDRFMPSAEEEFNASRLAASDFRAMLSAIQCCMRERKDTTQHVLDAYSPLGPEGTLVGGTFALYVGRK